MHWDKLLDQFGAGSFTMGAIIESVIGHFSSDFDYESVKEFFTGKKVGSGKRSLEQSMEQILINIYWRKNSESQIRHWISQKLDRSTNVIAIYWSQTFSMNHHPAAKILTMKLHPVLWKIITRIEENIASKILEIKRILWKWFIFVLFLFSRTFVFAGWKEIKSNIWD